MARILHVLTSDDRRGAEVFGTRLAEALEARGHRNEVLAVRPGGSGSRLDVEVVGPGRGRAVRTVRSRARRVDVVVGHGADGLPVGALGTAGTRAAFVYRSIGDPNHWAASRRARRVRVRWFLRHAAAVVALWDEAATVIRRAYRVPAGHVRVIPNAADPDRWTIPTDAARAAARRRLGLAEGPVVAVVGALSPEKRVGLAVHSIVRDPSLQLVVAGDGPDRPAIASLAAASDRRVHLLGSVADLTDLYAAADVVLSTSATEGQPGALIEAGMSGLPIVATDVGGTASVVGPGDRLVPPRAGPGEILGAVRSVLGAEGADTGAARRRRHHAVRRFAMDRVADGWSTLVDDLVASRATVDPRR